MLFIKMLRQLANFQYNPKKVKARTISFLEKLKAQELSTETEADSMEIIPYENVWEIIMNRLETRPKIDQYI